MAAGVLSIIFWTTIKMLVCISAFVLPIILMMYTRNVAKQAVQPRKLKLLKVANVLLALTYGGLILSRQLSALDATVPVGYGVAFVTLLVVWLIDCVKRMLDKLRSNRRPQEVSEHEQAGVEVSMS